MTDPQLQWNLDPAILVPLAIFAALYAARFRAARREAGGRGTGPLRSLAFAAALLVLFAAVASPIDRLGEDHLFSMHMTQHLLLGDIAPLLVLLSLSRVIMRPATRRLMAVERALGPFAHPLSGIASWFLLIYVWHVPALYVAAIKHPLLHLLEHASFFAAGVAVWWPLVAPVPMRRRLTGLGTLAYVGAAKLGLGVLGVYLAWSTSVAYPYYESVPRVWGLSALEDQNIGGAIMMVEQSLVLVVAFAYLLVRMLGESERDERRRERLADATSG